MKSKIKFMLKSIIPSNFNRVDWVQRSLYQKMEELESENKYLVQLVKKQNEELLATNEMIVKLVQKQEDNEQYLIGLSYAVTYGFIDLEKKIVGK